MLLNEILIRFIIPIIIAILTYLLVDHLGEYKKRKDYSRLGIAVIDSFLEEVRTGINIMASAIDAAENNNLSALPGGLLPNKSWSGMTTISDDVLLRIIATSSKGEYVGLHPRDCRIHCKNYFEHMNKNYGGVITTALNLAQEEEDWQVPIVNLLSDEGGHYLQATRRVEQMLVEIRDLLDKNVRSFFPK